MAHTTLVSTQALGEHLQAWRVFDCRHDLARPDLGEQQYREAHIPGALFAHLDRDLSAEKGPASGRHPLPDRGAFIAWLGQQGLRREDQVVCYDAAGGATAARLWWMLRWVGHDAVAVLDGGLAKWRAEGRSVTAEVPRFPRSSYPVRRAAHAAVDATFVESNRDSVYLIDARAPSRYRGEQEPIDPVAGRIPGARNRFNNDNLSPEGGFKTAAELRKDFSALLGERSPAEVVHYCGSGVSACHNLLAMEIAGLPGAKLYAGSWSEWITDPRRPQERG
jgi:thiosulfate/3-mercaptopyruvate sulfurtransferase